MGGKHKGNKEDVLFEQVRPPVLEIPVTPQCCVPFPNNFWKKWAQHAVKRREQRARRLKWNPDLCMKASSFVIGGNHYCRQHAGPLILNLISCKAVELKVLKPEVVKRKAKAKSYGTLFTHPGGGK